MIKNIQSHIPSFAYLPSSAKPASAIPAQPIQFQSQDKVSLGASKGIVPTFSLFTATGSSTVQDALAKLNSSPTQENFRQSQASFRVAIRSLSKPELQAAQQAITEEMQKTGDYRTQVFLDEIAVDVKMEIFWRDRNNSFQNASVVSQALNQLHSSPTQENLRKAQAGFRVAIRSLSRSGLDNAESAIKAEMERTSDYRTQVFLDKILTDVKMERFSRDLK